MNEPRIWLIAYIDQNYLETVEHDLLKHGYGDVKAYIPTIRVVKKHVKGKLQFENIPLLFNYGFFNVSYIAACNEDFLINLKNRIPCIISWVKDVFSLLNDSPTANNSKKGNRPMAAMASEKEIAELILTSENMSIFSDDIVDKLKPGATIILKGYPYENIPAEVIKINKKDKNIKVRLILDTLLPEVSVGFENVFYTIYSNYDVDYSREECVDNLEASERRKVDKLYAHINYESE